MHPADSERHEEGRFLEMRDSVAARLTRVCGGMDGESFDALVVQIAAFKIKWGETLLYDNPPALGAWMFAREKEKEQGTK